MNGYLRKDGRKGIRNIIVVTYLVECAHHVADMIVREFPLKDDVHVVGFGGCAPNDYAERMMQELCTHPNVGGVVICSLGCENFNRDRLLNNVRDSGREASLIVIQDVGGTRTAIDKGVEAVREMLSITKRHKMVTMELSDLCIGTVCGGSDAWSGLTANAVGGLTTIEEKSLGSYCKSGSGTIQKLITPAERPPRCGGLYMMDVVPDGEPLWGFPNISDNAEIMEMIASGCHIILYTTGRGSVAGSAISPVIKVCSNPDTFRRMEEDMDINAGKIITEGASFDDIASEIINLITDIADGKQTKSEALGHREYYIGYKHFDNR